ncbi:MAG: hypothetical protein ACE5GS_14465 [Kiloniellaceae bacterium]
MRRCFVLPAVLMAALLVGAAPVSADPPSPLPPGFDWRDLIEDSGTGDHVVGEEMCARPQRPAA